MLKTAFRSALVLMSFGVASAYAADTGSSQNSLSASSSASSSQDPSGNMNVKQEIQNTLSKQGYTDVSVMPSSFLVHAKNSKGQPVAMVIGPDSVTTVTELPPASQSGSNSDSKPSSSK
ncbi:hypothetical protein [Lichenibacterium dinghuense]|uniref:hypothetical protein n=1 Tax=Lichenibacterium dinghuense TaxID=2895977 RepID=UPI001F3D0EDD|nr:hypothetical protein [Lichenibacterium sp. 6Y81]